MAEAVHESYHAPRNQVIGVELYHLSPENVGQRRRSTFHPFLPAVGPPGREGSS